MGVAGHGLALQLEGLINFALADKWTHVDFNRACHLLATDRRVNQLDIAVFPLVAALTVLVERALSLEAEIELVGVTIPIHLKRLTNVLLGTPCPSKFEDEGLLNIDLEGGDF